MRRFERWQWTVVGLSSLAGLGVAIVWMALLSIPFADWPAFAMRVAQCMVPALFIPFNSSSGLGTVLVFTFVALSNAVLYGVLSLFVVVKKNPG